MYMETRYPELLQELVDILVKLFECVGLLCNIKKTQVMVYIPDKIRVRFSLASYH